MADSKPQLPPQLQEQLQQQLRDVQLPVDISWWPLAFGWWIIIAIMLTGMIALWIRLGNQYRQNRYRKLAIGEFKNTFALWQESQNTASYLQSANNILKRCVVHIESAHSANTRSYASLCGQRWIDVLHTFNKTPLSAQCQHALGQLVYTENPNCEVVAIHQELLAWLKHHQADLLEAKTPTPQPLGDQHA